MKKALTISIIIPVYNEESCLEACLDAIADQSVTPNEVIVIDNNSIDNSVKIAKSYPFVRVIHEKNQGFTYARNTGYDSATSDIFGRIDADAVIAKNWVETVAKNFQDNFVDGITGLGSADVFPRIKHPKTVLWSWWYFVWTRCVYRLPIMWGANMAIRSSAWQKIRDEVIMDNKLVHEDQDISLCILEHGGHIKKDNSMRITTGGQTYHYFPKLLAYTYRMHKTKWLHATRPEFRVLRRSPPLLCIAPLWLFPGLIILPIFFAASLLFFPVDYAFKRHGSLKQWLK